MTWKGEAPVRVIAKVCRLNSTARSLAFSPAIIRRAISSSRLVLVMVHIQPAADRVTAHASLVSPSIRAETSRRMWWVGKRALREFDACSHR
jgi:hypothetical protein